MEIPMHWEKMKLLRNVLPPNFMLIKNRAIRVQNSTVMKSDRRNLLGVIAGNLDSMILSDERPLFLSGLRLLSYGTLCKPSLHKKNRSSAQSRIN